MLRRERESRAHFDGVTYAYTIEIHLSMYMYKYWARNLQIKPFSIQVFFFYVFCGFESFAVYREKKRNNKTKESTRHPFYSNKMRNYSVNFDTHAYVSFEIVGAK